MKKAKSIYSKSKITLIAFAVLIAVLFNYFKNWDSNSHPFPSDANQYYSYLVAAFIHDDLSFSFDNPYWTHIGPKGIEVQKMSVGVAIMESPFFLLAHFITGVTEGEQTGYSPWYNYLVSIGGILYVFLALLVLRKILLYYFNDNTTTLTLIGILLSTNLYYYTAVYNTLSHSYEFFAITLVLYFSLKFNQTQRLKHWYLALLFCGLATVIRPTQALSVFIPFLYGVSSWEALRNKIKQLISVPTLLYSLLLFLLPVLPQLMYWKYATGNFFYFSYEGESFFFKNPKLWDVLFSFRKGWFLYTPICAIAFIGLYAKAMKSFRWIFIVYISTSIYIIASWWCWWYGGSFGMRSMIGYYPLLALPLAAFLQYALRKNVLVTCCLLFVLMAHNIVSTVQFKNIVIHWDGMNYEAYKYGLFKIQFNQEERKVFNELISTPDYQGARKGVR